MESILRLKNISLRDRIEVGWKNAFLGEIFTNQALQGIMVPDGFSITATAYRQYIEYNKLDGLHNKLIAKIDKENSSNLAEIGKECRGLILGARMPGNLYNQITSAYLDLGYGSDIEVAVRSSSLSPDFSNLPKKDKHDTFLHVKGKANLIESVKKCFASLYSDLALMEGGTLIEDQAISVGVQKMVGTNSSCSGFAYTADPQTNFKDVIHISATPDLQDKGLMEADEYIVYKPIIHLGLKSIIQKKYGGISKPSMGNRDAELPILELINDAEKFALIDEEILSIAKWGMVLENYFNSPVSMEWIKDSTTDEIYLLQTKPLNIKKNIEISDTL